MKQPAISVLMTAYNTEAYITESIQSILNQSLMCFELIILDDGSTDSTFDIIEEFSDPRIKLFQNEKNCGLTYSRNKCLELAQGTYIAWLDADDLATPDRLEKQFNFMEANPEFAMIGGWVQPIDKSGNAKGKVWKYYAKPEEIPAELFFHNYFAQSAVMIRKSMLPEIRYLPDYPPVEDYELWIRIAENGKCWNLQEVVLKYRVYDQSITFRESDKHLAAKNLITKNQLSKLCSDPNKADTYQEFITNKISDFTTLKKHASELKELNIEKKLYRQKIFNAKLVDLLIKKAPVKTLLYYINIKQLPDLFYWFIIQLRKIG